jgi:hypothetical protein
MRGRTACLLVILAIALTRRLVAIQ